MLYCFSPYLNRLVQNLSQKSYEQLLLLWGFFFIFAPTILFFEIQNDTGKGIINVTLAYLIGQYLKVYGLPENMKRHSWDILSGSLAGIFILNSLLTAMSGNIILRFARDNNLLIIIASIMIFYQFTRRHFSSRIINYLAGYVFALYMLQGLLIHCLQPVSYTHLDVYKRQVSPNSHLHYCKKRIQVKPTLRTITDVLSFSFSCS